MKQTPYSTSSPGVNSCSASQEIPCLLQNLNVDCHVQRNLPLIPVISLANSVHTTKFYADGKHINGQEILYICAM